MAERSAASKRRAGHYEVQGETIAKFELFDEGWNPYSRYLDEDGIDLIARRRTDDGSVVYREVQVKYGKLYECKWKWERQLFDVTSWKIFKEDAFGDFDDELVLCYVLARSTGYAGDIFFFPVREFEALIRQAIPINTKSGRRYKMFISHAFKDDDWYLRRSSGFEDLSDSGAVVSVGEYRRNFGVLDDLGRKL